MIDEPNIPPVNPFYRYDVANSYFNTMKNYNWHKPEYMEANDFKREIELYLLWNNKLPDSIDAYCQAVVRAWTIYVEEMDTVYWKDDMEGLSRITRL